MSRYKVAIVGAGPAGYFAAQALQNLQSAEHEFSIGMIERLPTPRGLVRSGVAPDHPKIKTVISGRNTVGSSNLSVSAEKIRCFEKSNFIESFIFPGKKLEINDE